MPAVCYKPFSITVGHQITAYWTMDQPNPDSDQPDSVANRSPMTWNCCNLGGVPGKIGLAFQLGGESFGGFDTGSHALDYTEGQSLSFWGWFKIVATGPGTLFSPYLSFYCFFGQQLMIELGNTNNPGNVHIMATRGANDLYFNVPLNTWHFFHLFHDASNSTDGYSIDAGAPGTLPNPSVWQSDNTTDMILRGNWGGPTGSVIFDEIGIIIGSKLTPTQVAYLYNAGFGRTWPITLPP